MAIAFNKIKTEYDFLDVMPFGDFRGKTISWLIEFQPEYLQWCSKQPNLLYLSNKCLEALEDRVALEKFNKEIKRNIKQLKHDMIQDFDWGDMHFDDVPF